MPIVHGWETNGNVEAHDFEPIFTRLPGYRRIYVDLPGMGSTPAGGIENMDDIFTRLVQFVDATIKTSKFPLIGSSAGAYLSRALAIRYRRQVDGLLLRVPLIEPATGERDLDAFAPIVSDAGVMVEVPAADLDTLGEILVQSPEYISAWKTKLTDIYHPAIAQSDAAVLRPIREDPRRYRLSSLDDAGAERLESPTLIVCGRQDTTTGYRDSLRLLERYPRSTFAVLDGETHGLPVHERAVFEALVEDWLRRVGELSGAI